MAAGRLASMAQSHPSMAAGEIRIRPAESADLDAINRVIELALMTWTLPERVKRLSLPVYRYTCQDLRHLDMMVAEDRRRQVLGLAAWEEAGPRDTPAGCRALLLHGIYVDPAYHRQGIGRRLFAAAEAAVARQGCDGLLVRAQRDATAFFVAQGMCRLSVDEQARQYANRLWKDLHVVSSADCQSSVHNECIANNSSS